MVDEGRYPRLAELSDEQIIDLLNEKVPVDDARAPTPTEIAFARAAFTPVERWRKKGGGWHWKGWEGECDVIRMHRLVQREPSLIASIGARLLKATISVRGCAPAVSFLLDEGAQLDYSPTHYNCLHEAAWAGCTENLAAVFEFGAADASCVARTVHTGWPDTVSLLYWSVSMPEQADLLLQYGADPEVPITGNGERGTTVLQHAVAPPFDGAGAPWHNPELLKKTAAVADLLLAHGAKYDIYSACGRDDLQRVQSVVRQDSNLLGRPSEGGMTPLHWAVRGNAARCAKWLLSKGVDVNAKTTSRRSALHMAAEWNHTDMIWLLADAGIDLDSQDTKGRTALHRATYGGQLEATEVLIVLGADHRRTTKNGKTAQQLARFECKFLKE